MDCAEEVSLLRRELSRVDGVRDLRFDILQGALTVELDPKRTSRRAIEQAIERTGMRGEPWQETPPLPAFWQIHGRRLLIAFSGVCLLAAMILHARGAEHFALALLAHHAAGHLSPLVIALCALAIVAGAFFTLPKAWAAARQGRPDMNVLVCISIAGAAYLGEWIEGATLAFLYALANALEAWSIGRARKAVGSLIAASPGVASVVHGDHEHPVPVAQVPVGSVVRVRPGERIPFDGEVVAGISGVNQAMVTGESVPIVKQPGDRVFAGTMNSDGTLDIRTDRAASDTTIARIVRMVSDSTPRRAPSEQFVQRFARVYTPVMIGLAGLATVFPPLFLGRAWADSFYQGMVILLISCPCALVISTPVTIVAALASAARRGVLIKGGAYLEMAAKLRALAFDKTGVLTEGEPSVQTLLPVGGRVRERILERMAALESRSEHPLARAILRYAREQGARPAPAADFRALPGRGAVATIEGEEFWAGSTRLLEQKAPGDSRAQNLAAPFEDSAHTVVFCGAGRELWAVVGFEDKVRSEAPAALRELRRAGVRAIIMLTGDNAKTAEAVARQLGIDDVRADLLPEDKAAAMRELLHRQAPAAMVGDGVNDAPAMAAASLGIALGRRSTDVALETADIVLMNDDLRRLAFLVRHSRRALAIIQQNIAFALLTKAAFLIAAFLGAVNLWMAVGADMGATLLVTLNGLRMLSARERQ